ncbi:MAG: hypothetical protein JKY56_08730 [Kofleriaceae bacterium]|nr:hypothetical protein [Kofleriaceae bacterium]
MADDFDKKPPPPEDDGWGDAADSGTAESGAADSGTAGLGATGLPDPEQTGSPQSNSESAQEQSHAQKTQSHEQAVHEASQEMAEEDADEWSDPVNIEGRVAALEEKSHLPASERAVPEFVSIPPSPVEIVSARTVMPETTLPETTLPETTLPEPMPGGLTEDAQAGVLAGDALAKNTQAAGTLHEEAHLEDTQAAGTLHEEAQLAGVQLGEAAGVWHAEAQLAGVPLGEAQAVDDEDAPQWSRDDIELPAPSSDMLAAAGVLAEKEDPKAEKRRKKRLRGPRTQLTQRQQIIMIGGAAAVVVVGIGALLGYFNSKHYYFVCDTDGIRAEQGRFWPWGQSPLSGPAFREIRIPKDVLCTSREYDSHAELEDAFLSALLSQATTLLSSGDSDQVSEAAQQLEQALLLTRDPERSKERNLAKRLQGDVLYWHGAAEIEQAIRSLKAAAEQFKKATAKRPRHSSDANPWAEHALYLQEELDKGPRSLRKDESPKDEPHFQGLSDPKPDTRADAQPRTPDQDVWPSDGLQPDKPDETPASQPNGGTTLDAGTGSADGSHSTDANSPRPDAGLPKGGVLL